MIEEYGRNINGIDYFVGDIHGCYELLLETLENIDFDFHNDRLFATGDIIDRGHGSIDMLELLNEEWFFTVIGNHESDIQEFILEDFGTATVDDTNHSRLYWEYEDGEW